ncbi:hypothetical protein MMC12_006736 [Toensbergia leucococca]|nr:hypothetical protein [Toensbergia leucococca]
MTASSRASQSHEERTALESRQNSIHVVTLTKISQVNTTIRLLQLSIPSGNHIKASAPPLRPFPKHPSLQFLPGQWLDVHIRGLAQAGGFTITSTPQAAEPSRSPHTAKNGYLDLAIQKSPRNPPAAWLWQPEPEILGSELLVKVGGSFVWPPPGIDVRSVKKVVLVAGGVGIK